MFKIKKIDIYVFKNFISLFIVTFLICIFILLMQFLWRHFEDLVGKGIGWSVLFEFFFYSALSLVPMALPLAILLASLMTFGNLGETLELTAMKAAGVSLFQIMRPLLFFISLICVAAFFFSNFALPMAQTKLWTLIFSLKQKSPELEIPVGEFYTGINGYNIYVREKDGKILKDLMIYDFSAGFDNAIVMVADSGEIQLSSDKKNLLLSLYSGESFENLKNQQIGSSPSSIPYRRESFRTKEIVVDFNAEFNRFDESLLNDQHISKNISQLSQSIDSVNKIVRSMEIQQSKEIMQHPYINWSINQPESTLLPEEKLSTYSFDSLFLSLNEESMFRAIDLAISEVQQIKSSIDFNKIMLEQQIMYVRRHWIEWHRKFTLSFACLIFFFIGAPLGAIIRKGGFGMPVVISVVMFIIYYIIDNTGYKMAREGIWSTFQGMWLSSAVLLPIGIFLTYKAVTDSALFNSENYTRIWNSLVQKIKIWIDKFFALQLKKRHA
ncbi:MAG TPA: LptF/LptG family permease [Paludibacteraceae bacterium]|nr:LptF/LptG family permease [Paludibacteraceae bacterium]HPD59245.1 LptF/LptG family permease [Paludibacteraceae bacterium]HQF11658.1 LptF/LptG family permease [Paludibacteraceae bacterium]HRS24002.1 LptF/LptG family permease [Paludibacteraceae bacterium]HRT78510.1 LptF/LptG family permease [Paludibacteraceae bacterium]